MYSVNTEDLCCALQTMGCSDEELETVWSLLAAILHLGNLQCSDAVDGAGGSSGSGGHGSDIGITHVNIVSPTLPLEELSALLGVSSRSFCSHLATQRVKISAR